jgi:hypothetical protein
MRYSMCLVMTLFILAGIFFIDCAEDKDTRVTGNNGTSTYVDSVWVSDATVAEGEQAVVTVNFSNSVNLIRVELPLKVYGSGFYIDSVSFATGRCPTEALQLVTIDSTDQWVRILWHGGPSLSPGSGLLGNMYLSTDVGTSGSSLTIDSVTIGTYPASYFMYYMKTTGSLIYPGFGSGTVTIE